MTALPIALRELRVGSRRRNTYRVRFGAAIVAVAITAWIFLVARSSTPPAALGRDIFSTLAGIFFFFTLLVGSRVTADCLSEEKREGTLGLLFLTDLRGYDVVIGKLAATSMNCIYGLLAAFPVLTLPLLLGGVSWALVWHVAIILINTLFFSLSAGIFASSICRNERNAMGIAFLCIVGVAGGLPAVGAACGEFIFKMHDPGLMRPFLLPSPFVLFSSTMLRYSGGPIPALPAAWFDFWGSFATIHALGWMFLLLACKVAPRSWQDSPDSPWRERWRYRWQRWCYGDSAARAALRDQLLDINPFLWLCGGRDRLQSSMLWGFLGLLAVGFVWGAFKFGTEWLAAPVAVTTAIIYSISLKFWMASETTRRFLEIRRDGALELLACTPMTIEEILRGQRMAVRRLFGWPLMTILVVYMLMMAMGLKDATNAEDRRLLIVAFFSGMIMLVADYHALVWVGTWDGLTAKNAKTASGNAVFRVLMLPWLIWMFTLPFYFMWRQWGPNPNREPSGIFMICWWLAIGLAVDWYFGRRAHRRLHEEFRVIAALRFLHLAKRRWWWPFSHEIDTSNPT